MPLRADTAGSGRRAGSSRKAGVRAPPRSFRPPGSGPPCSWLCSDVSLATGCPSLSGTGIGRELKAAPVTAPASHDAGDTHKVSPWLDKMW